MVASSDAWRSVNLAGQCTFKRPLSKRLVCVRRSPAPYPFRPRAPEGALRRVYVHANHDAALTVQVFADLELLPIDQPSDGEVSHCTLPAAVELVISAQNGAGDGELNLWRHSVRWALVQTEPLSGGGLSNALRKPAGVARTQAARGLPTVGAGYA